MSVKPQTILCTDVFSTTVAAIEAAAAEQEIASIIFTGSTADPRAYVEAAKPLVTAAQSLNIAALVVGETPMVGHIGADGLHVDAHGKPEDYLKGICATLKPKHIVGVGDIRTRDDAFMAAECDVDYVLFGNPASPTAKGNEIEKLLDFTAWWAEIMELPCICMCPASEHEAAILNAGPEFIGYILK